MIHPPIGRDEPEKAVKIGSAYMLSFLVMTALGSFAAEHRVVGFPGQYPTPGAIMAVQQDIAQERNGLAVLIGATRVVLDDEPTGSPLIVES